MAFIIFIAALVSLVWLAAYVRRGSLVWAVLAFLLLNSSFGVYFWHAQAGPLPLTLDRIALAVLLGVFALHWKMVDRVAKPWAPADTWMVAFLAALMFSTFSHDWNSAPEETVAPIWRLITGYLSPAIIYVVGRQMSFGARQSKQLLAALTLFGVYLSITAIFEIAGQWSLVFPKIIAEPTLGFHFGRARGPMLHSVAFGFYLGACLVAAWLWCPRYGRAGGLLLAALSPLFLLGIYLSYTRSVWIGAVLGLGVVLALTLPRSWRPLVLGAGIVTGVAALGLGWDKFMGFEREYSAAGTRESASLRSSFVYVSWKMFLDHPLLGCGFGQFYVEKMPYLSDRSTEMELEAIRPLIHHNMPLGLLTETGVIGLGLFLALVAAWSRDAWRLWNSDADQWVRLQGAFCLALLGVYLPQALFHEISYMNMVHMLLFFVAGVSTGLCQAQCVQWQPARVAAPLSSWRASPT